MSARKVARHTTHIVGFPAGKYTVGSTQARGGNLWFDMYLVPGHAAGWIRASVVE